MNATRQAFWRTTDEDLHYDNLATQLSLREEAEFQLSAAQAERIPVISTVEPGIDIQVRVS